MFITKNNPTAFKDFLEIDEESKIPKYQQLVDTLLSDIKIGIVKIGERIPSINETSEEFYLSRDTVIKAYDTLRNRGVITSVKGKGYYVSSTAKNNGKRILLLLNKLSDHKKTIYNAFVSKLPTEATVDLQIHNCDPTILEKIIIENLGKYDHYVIMPHLNIETASVKAAINKIPKEKLIFVNKDLDDIDGEYSCVFEDFEQDIFDGLSMGLKDIRKYSRLYLIFPSANNYCAGIKSGFVKFCELNGFDWKISDSPEIEMKRGELYIVIEDADLIEIIKKVSSKNLKLGADVGLISYNKSAFKEILAGGICVLSTDFEKMGNSVAEIIKHSGNSRTKLKIKNPFTFIKRDSV